MKRLFIFLCVLLALTSCSFWDNNSLTENTSNTEALMTGSETHEEENSKKVELSKFQNVIVEKTCFYTNADDAEPRKAYVMWWDRVTLDYSKSTEDKVLSHIRIVNES